MSTAKHRARRVRRRTALLLAGAALVPAAAYAGSVDTWASGKILPYGFTDHTNNYHYATLSYCHQLAGGTYTIGAGAYNYASYIYNQNSASHSYSGGVNLRGSCDNPTANHIDYYFNAHVDY